MIDANYTTEEGHGNLCLFFLEFVIFWHTSPLGKNAKKMTHFWKKKMIFLPTNEIDWDKADFLWTSFPLVTTKSNLSFPSPYLTTWPLFWSSTFLAAALRSSFDFFFEIFFDLLLEARVLKPSSFFSFSA